MSSSKSTTPAFGFETSLQQFYNWITRWRRGLTERTKLEEEFAKLVVDPNTFSWCNASGILQTSQSFMSNLVYGSSASYLTLSVQVRNVSPLHSPSDDDDCYLIVGEVWETFCKESVQDETTTAKQISAWMKNSSSSDQWLLIHVQETYVKGHEPPASKSKKASSRQKKSKSTPKGRQEEEEEPMSPWATSTTTPNSIPSSRRHVAQNVLEKYKAKPLLWNGCQLVGISIAGWDIGTSQGPIGDSAWFEQALDELEPLAQYKIGGYRTFLDLSTDRNMEYKDTSTTAGQQRRLVLPEMVFPLAHVVLDRRAPEGDLFLSWDAMDCLKDWSKCHQAIPMPTTKNIDDDEGGEDRDKRITTISTTTATPSATGGGIEFRGVSVLQSSDAHLWQRNKESGGDAVAATVGTTEFHYDWTYSTPFYGKFYGSKIRQPGGWIVCEESGMPMHLLTDQSVPILYFDSLVLLEDDLHDNGLVQYTVKVRVMPTCAYVLSRLFVRVDNVLVRIRDCRLLVHFAASKLYRDITWRDCLWSDLEQHNLPTDIRAWKQEDIQETPTFNFMLNKIPLTPLPKDMPAHAELSYRGT